MSNVRDSPMPSMYKSGMLINVVTLQYLVQVTLGLYVIRCAVSMIWEISGSLDKNYEESNI